MMCAFSSHSLSRLPLSSVAPGLTGCWLETRTPMQVLRWSLSLSLSLSLPLSSLRGDLLNTGSYRFPVRFLPQQAGFHLSTVTSVDADPRSGVLLLWTLAPRFDAGFGPAGPATKWKRVLVLSMNLRHSYGTVLTVAAQPSRMCVCKLCVYVLCKRVACTCV